MRKGRFISLEGGEGAGKTTLRNTLIEWIEGQGFSLVVTREPGGTPLSEKLRDLILHGDHVCAEAELLMMFAARAQLLNDIIRPALQRGDWVLSDRFVDASFAYQVGGRGLSSDWVEDLSTHVVGETLPDRTILLDVPVDVGLQRIGKRGDLDRMEQSGVDFMHRVREQYLTRANQNPDRFRVIDASRSLDVVKEQAIDSIQVFI
ncbi:MAG: dTMP kinase [bacterium]